MKYLKKINEINFDYKKVNQNSEGSFHMKGDTISSIFIDNELVGNLHYRVKDDLFHIIWIDIIEKYRGKGNGDEIMIELDKKAKLENSKKMQLEVMYENKVAINLYTKHGFKVTEKEGIFLIMTKIIL